MWEGDETRSLQADREEVEAPGLISSFFRAYTPVILCKGCYLATSLVYLAYLAGALYGISVVSFSLAVPWD